MITFCRCLLALSHAWTLRLHRPVFVLVLIRLASEAARACLDITTIPRCRFPVFSTVLLRACCIKLLYRGVFGYLSVYTSFLSQVSKCLVPYHILGIFCHTRHLLSVVLKALTDHVPRTVIDLSGTKLTSHLCLCGPSPCSHQPHGRCRVAHPLNDQRILHACRASPTPTASREATSASLRASA
jgi:hypothetical protein